MNKVELAREIFKTLEGKKSGNVADMAIRRFSIQDRLNKR
jgi:hypothetical protein